MAALEIPSLYFFAVHSSENYKVSCGVSFASKLYDQKYVNIWVLNIPFQTHGHSYRADLNVFYCCNCLQASGKASH